MMRFVRFAGQGVRELLQPNGLRFERSPNGLDLRTFTDWANILFLDIEEYKRLLTSDCKKQGIPLKIFREEVHDAELGRLGDKPWIPLCRDIKQRCADPDLMRPGIYEIGIQAPGSNKIVPVYSGRAGTSNADSARCTGDRLLEHWPRPQPRQYRPQELDNIPNMGETQKRVSPLRLQRILTAFMAEGFSVHARAIQCADLIEFEKRMLTTYDYAFNQQHNRPGVRLPIMEKGKVEGLSLTQNQLINGALCHNDRS